MTIESNWCTLRIEEKGLYAFMCLHTNHGEEGLSLSVQFVYDFLQSQGIVYGINNIAIMSLVEHVMYEQYICVAKGTPATRGENGYHKFVKSTEDMKKKPLINEDGTADYKNSLNLATITEGELLATYIPPTLGTAGRDVYGQEIPALGDGKNIPPLRGRGIVADDNNQNFYALYSGHIVREGSKIYIDKLFRVDGDLNIEFGNIRFDGDVEVVGDVRSGLQIEATGSIFIHGHVGACILTAGQNIVIEKGIQGKGSCTITSNEDVVCKFVESCKIMASGNIYADSVLGSYLVAKKQIIITSRTGNVLSSEVYGMCGVIIKEAGNSAGMSTLLRAGLPREYYTKATTIENSIKEIDNKISQFNHHLETIDNQDTRMQIIRARIVLTSQKTKLAEELATLTEQIKEDANNSFINIIGTIYDGVRVYIGSYPYIVNEAVKEVTFRIHNGSVVMLPLSDNN